MKYGLSRNEVRIFSAYRDLRKHCTGAWKPVGQIRGDHVVGAWFMSDDVMLVVFRVARPR